MSPVIGKLELGLWLCLAHAAGGIAPSTVAQESTKPSPDAFTLALTPGEAAWLRSRKVVRYGSDPSWPPFSMRTREGLEGIDHDLAGLFEKRLGVKFEYVPTGTWDETLQKMERGEVDFVTGYANLPERPVEVLFTRPYSAFPVATIMRNDGPFFTSLEQIEGQGLTLAVPAGYAPTVYIEENFPGIKLLRTRTSFEALRRVSEGSADISLENLGVAAHLIRENGFLNLKITGSTGHRFDPAFGVAVIHPELRSILNKLLDSVTKQEQLQIYQKWVLVEISRMWSWQKVVLVCSLILLIAALVIGMVLISNRRLARELERRRVVEESLRRSEERFRNLFERMDEAYFLTQTDGKIQFVNETAVEMLGIGSRPVVERLNLGTFLERGDDLGEILEELRSGEKVRDRTVAFVRADGSLFRSLCVIRLLEEEFTAGEVGMEWLARVAP